MSASKNNANSKTKKKGNYEQGRLRFLIFLLWVGYLVVTCFTVLMAPLIRVNIDQHDIPDALFNIAGIWMPVLGCLAAFWFGNREEQQLARQRKIDKDRAISAIVCTVVYLTLVYGFIVWQAFLVNTDGPEYQLTELPQGYSFTERMIVCVKWATLTSPFGTAPVIWLTGGITSNNQSKRTG